uniref:Uncharacterized protein n=1 Tax=Poecilia mexicana TaxID=48701 RepID=A0A3B3WT16_9TELE
MDVCRQRRVSMSEKAEEASITVFDLHQEHGMKKKVLTAGDFLVQEFLCMAFSPDSKYLIGQSGAPEWLLIFWTVSVLRRQPETEQHCKGGVNQHPVSHLGVRRPSHSRDRHRKAAGV